MLRNIIKLFKELKHSRVSLKICPKCDSTKVRQSSTLNSWLMPAYYICENCGYHGPIIKEIVKDGGQESKGLT